VGDENEHMIDGSIKQELKSMEKRLEELRGSL
jgi:F0F1-type ATP synthase delta subunit